MARLTDGDIIIVITECGTSGNRGQPWNQMYSRHAQVPLHPPWKNLCWVLLCPPATSLFSLPLSCQTFWMKNGATHHPVSSTPPPALRLPPTALLKPWRGHQWTDCSFLNPVTFFPSSFSQPSPRIWCSLSSFFSPSILWFCPVQIHSHLVSSMWSKHGLGGLGLSLFPLFSTLCSFSDVL